MTVAIANDYEVVVRGLASMLADYASRVRVVECDVRVPVAQPVDVVLYDTFSQGQGEQLDIDDLVADPKVGALAVYSWNLQEALVSAALRAGATAYLSKGLSGEQLVHALERVHAGEQLRPDPGHDEHPVETDDGDWPGRGQGLTCRESEVLALIAQGLSNEEIARRVYLSINTVKSYIRSAYRRMGVTTRSQAVGWAARNGFSLEPPTRILNPTA